MPNIAAFRSVATMSFKGLSTLRGSNFNLGLAAADSETKTEFCSLLMCTVHCVTKPGYDSQVIVRDSKLHQYYSSISVQASKLRSRCTATLSYTR